MRKRVTIGMLLLLGLVAALLVLPELFSTEPKYQGKRLSVWFKQYYRTGNGSPNADAIDHQEAEQALKAIGTNAVPWLVSHCFDIQPDSALRAKVQPWLNKKLHFPPFVTAGEIAYGAINAVYAVRPPGGVLVTLVTNRLNDVNTTNRNVAICLLGCAGSDAEIAVPWLRPFLSGTNQFASAAAYSISRFGPAAAAAVPELIEMVRDSRLSPVSTLSVAYLALGSIGPAASNAAPLLRERFMAETKTYMRDSLAKTLCQIDLGHVEDLDFLLARLQNPATDGERGTICGLLGELGPVAKPAVPVLANMLRSESSQIAQPAAEALLKIGETNLVRSGYEEKLRSEHASIRGVAAVFILQNDPTNLAAITNLIAFVHDANVGPLVARQLTRLRPVPPSAAATLREIAADQKSAERRNAVRALQSLKDEEAKKR